MVRRSRGLRAVLAPLVAGALFGLGLQGLQAGTARWELNGDLSSSTGQAALEAVGYPGAAGAPGVTFTTDLIGGVTAQVAQLSEGTALVVRHGFPHNGGGAYLNNYTLILDVKLPNALDWTSLYQTNEAYDDAAGAFDLADSNDGDWFVDPNGGIGISGNYGGAVASGTWYRLALVHDVAAGTFTSYIDGVQVQQNTGIGLDGRWSMYTSTDPDPYDWFFLFADETGVSEMSAVTLGSFQFRDVAASAAEIAALGGPTAFGIGVVPPSCDQGFFADDFDGYADDAALAAAGWQVVQANAPGENAQWSVTNPGVRRNPPTLDGSPSTGKFVISDSDWAGGGNTPGTGMSHDLITPAFSTTGGSSVWVHASCNAQLNNDAGNATAIFDVDVSTDGGASWTTAFRRIAPGTRTAPAPDNTNADGFFGQLAVDITAQAANRPSVQVRFRHFEPTDDWWVALDDIVVSCQAPPAGGSCTILSNQDFTGGLGAMTAVSAVGNTGTETWGTADKLNRYVAGAVSGRGVNRINQPNAAKNFAILESEGDPDPAEDEYLVTPKLNCTNFSEVYLHWKSETVLDNNATQEVLASLDGGVTYPITVFRYNQAGGAANALFDDGEESFYAERVLEVPQAAGQANVVFAFRYQSPGNERFWAIDDVQVTGTAAECDPRDCGLRAFAASYDAATNRVTGSWSSLPGDAGFRVLQGARVVADGLPATATSFVDASPPVAGSDVVYTLETLVDGGGTPGRGGWVATSFDYCFEGDAAAYVATDNDIGNLDGTWRRSNNSDEWDGSGSTPGAAAPGGIETELAAGQAEGGGNATVLSLEDVGDPRGAGFPDPGNRKLFLWRDTSGVLDLSTGVTLVARWRLNPAPRSAEFANNGGALPVPNGTSLHDQNKGQIGFVQKTAAGGSVAAGLNLAITDAGLLEFAVNAACGAGAGPRCFDIDELGWVTAWLGAQEEAGGVRVQLYLNGSTTPVIDEVITGINADSETAELLPAVGTFASSYLNIGLGSTGQDGAIQVDYLCAVSGLQSPVSLVKERDCLSPGVQTFVCTQDLASRADVPGKSVHVSWTPAVNAGLEGYRLLRNGIEIAAVGPTASEHLDTPALPQTKEHVLLGYVLQGVAAGGDPCGELTTRAILSSGTVCLADDFEDYANDIDLEVVGGWFRVDEVGTPPGEDATWTVQNPGGRSNPPTFDGKAATGRFAISDSDAGGGDNGAPGSGNSNDLWSPPFSTLGKTAVWLHMDASAVLNNNGKVVFDVDVSTDGGASWTNVFRRVAPQRTEAPPVVDTSNADGFFGALHVDLSALAANKPAVQFRVRSFEPSDDWWVAIDNVIVDDVPGPAGGSTELFAEDFAAGLGSMTAISLAGNSGTETWSVGDKCVPARSIVLAGGVFPIPGRDGRGVHRLAPPYAILESECDPDPVEDEYLITPALDCSGLASVFLHYKSEIVPEDASTEEVLVSLDGGDSFLAEPLFSYKGGGLVETGEDPMYADRVLGVPAAAGQSNVVFAFHYKSPGNQRFWAVDDVRVSGTPGCLAGFTVSIDGSVEATVGGTVTLSSTTDATAPVGQAWEVVSGPGAIVGSSTGASIDLTAASAGDVRVSLRITDGCGASATDEHVVTFVIDGGGLQRPFDMNQDGRYDLSDSVALLSYLFLGGVAPPCGDNTLGHAANLTLLNVNGDGRVDISDAVYALSFLFLGGPRPVNCADDACPCLIIADCPDNSDDCN